MSKYQLKCSCIRCHTEVTTQSLKMHYLKCTTAPKNVCGCCGNLTNNKKYCSHTCRATVVNTTRTRRDAKQPRVSKTWTRFLAGEITERLTLRKCIAKLHRYACNTCGVSEWNNKPITLIVDHINGNAGDNTPINLQLLCPNCNSQTDTFGGRNKGNGRKARGLPLH